jgi:hypothetical protein
MAFACSAWRLIRLVAVAAGCAALLACNGVQIQPDATLPKPLVVTLPTDVGLIIPGDMRNFVHKETRWGVDWTIALGAGHTHLMHEVFTDTFQHVQEFKSLDEARGAQNLKAIFEPRIEQYSFVTARETGGRYYAVTIRYRINLYTPTGDRADSFTLTGYGNALAKGMSSGKPLQLASVAAMRDAAAKFLVQFPEQPAGVRLARNEAIVIDKSPPTADAGGIDTVPIEEEQTAEAGPAVAPAPGITPPPPPATPASTSSAPKAS